MRNINRAHKKCCVIMDKTEISLKLNELGKRSIDQFDAHPTH